MINELRKNNLKKSQLDINIQYINSLRSEWRRFASNIQQNRNLEDIDIHELFELLNHNQDEVLEILGKEKNPEKYADPLALVVDRRQHLSGRSSRYEEDYDIPSDVGERGSEYDEEMSDMKKALALITRTMAKRTSRKPLSSNNHRYSNGKRYEARDRYEPKNEARRFERTTETDYRRYEKTRRYEEPRERRYEERRYQDRQYEDEERRYGKTRRFDRYPEPRRFDVGEKLKPEDKGKEPKKDNGSPTCFKCRKPGHFAKNCINHVSKYDYYKDKINLAKKKDDGISLLAEDEAWLQMSSDDEKRGLVCMLAQDDAWNVDSDEGKEDQLCLMADADEEYSEDDDRDYNDVNSDHSDSSCEVLPDPYIELENQVKTLAQKVSEYENKIKQANKRTTIDESKLATHSKEKVTTLTLANKTLEDKVASLNDNISDLQKKLHEAEVLSRESLQKYEVIFAQITNLFAKIKDMEDKFLKMNQEVPILERVYKDKKTFYEKRITKVEAELEDERRMSLRENDLFLSKINELEEALKSKNTPKASKSTFGTRDNSSHHHHTWNVNALDFRPSSTFSQNSNSVVLRSPICTTISYMDDLTHTTPKSTVQISEIVSDDCTNRVGENGRLSGLSKLGNMVPPKLSREDKGKTPIVTPESKVASTSRPHVTNPKKCRRSLKNKKSSKSKEQSHNFHRKNKTSHHHSYANHYSSNVTDRNMRKDRRSSTENGYKEGSRSKPFAHKLGI
ncbi:hypothetical protein OSB04_019995 [Centaurea solstitialis]|uniref:CCHC-type domain-containing protein n=1 Tax=Centaurea solstitialis TaxID=347529 RepID=A0AA38T9U1_9ASTR|nr:hypothetical protein OSB04_019995 [Centaurea solstitialis]